jgi:hypothetical protein
MKLIRLLAIVAAIVGAMTWILGWWGVPLAAAVTAVLLRNRRGVAWLVALAAVIAWSALILVDGVGQRFGALARIVGGVLQVPAAALLAVTLLFAALLAWSAATIGAEVGRMTWRDAE